MTTHRSNGLRKDYDHQFFELQAEIGKFRNAKLDRQAAAKEAELQRPSAADVKPLHELRRMHRLLSQTAAGLVHQAEETAARAQSEIRKAKQLRGQSQRLLSEINNLAE